MMTSRLVETVMINVEDFADTFLTCGTCLCGYDAAYHTPKLLPCSHTVCRTCLERILETQASRSDTFRCPICREGITVPRGGAAAFPPSFLVNQLLDLMASQRRDLIPKCTQHPSQELLFCETCDSVFCAACADDGHSGPGALAHNVISFSIAIKRMSEILLYKAHLCIQQLNSAFDSVMNEVNRLDVNTDTCIQEINSNFEQLSSLVEKRRQDLLSNVRKIRDQKRRSLKEQLDMIEAEKEKVQQECDRLEYQTEVRQITKKISFLNEKLDSFGALVEPRENAFIRFVEEYRDGQIMFRGIRRLELERHMGELGYIHTSTTYPSLCTVEVEPCTVNLECEATVTTVDYHGQPRRTGNDPVQVDLQDPDEQSIPIRIEDLTNGSYKLHFRPVRAGRHKLSILILDRPIRRSPILMDVSAQQTPAWESRGKGFYQPFGVVLPTAVSNDIYVLDTGNSRIAELDINTGILKGHLGELAMLNQGGTGAAWFNEKLWILNWRKRSLFEVDPISKTVMRSLTYKELREPTSLAAYGSHFFVADNEAGCIFVFEAPTDQNVNSEDTLALVRRINDGVSRVTGLAVTGKGNLVLADNRIRVCTPEGNFLREFAKGRSPVGGIACVLDLVLATRIDRAKPQVQVFSVDSGAHLFDIDLGSRLRRPTGVAATLDGAVLVTDLADNVVHKYRYQ